MSDSSRRGVLCLAAALAASVAIGGTDAFAEPQIVATIQVRGGQVHLAVDGTGPAQARLRAWVERGAGVVAGYLGRFPIDETFVYVTFQAGSGVGHGITIRDSVGIVNVSVGTSITDAELRADWVLVHEMMHLAMPHLDQRHLWLAEGLATYTEAIARAQSGLLATGELWAGFAREMPRGLPKEGDRGLDHTHTWARTYWGGALFGLLADVAIREQTANRMGLQDALAAIAQGSRGDGARWDIGQVLQLGDGATGVSALADLYQRMKTAHAPPDLERLWTRLGIQGRTRDVRFNDEAPGAGVRRAISAPRQIGRE